MKNNYEKLILILIYINFDPDLFVLIPVDCVRPKLSKTWDQIIFLAFFLFEFCSNETNFLNSDWDNSNHRQRDSSLKLIIEKREKETILLEESLFFYQNHHKILFIIQSIKILVLNIGRRLFSDR